MKTTRISSQLNPSFILNLIERDDGKKKQTLEKASSMAFV